MRLTIAARKSDLARIQAYMVGDALQKNISELKIIYKFSSSLGDRNQHDPLWKMPEQGVFTQDFIRQLESGKVDMVVHSWKDLPTISSGKTVLAATLPRADHRDLLLVSKAGVKRAKESKVLRILTSSPRRAYNLEGFLPKAFPGGLESVSFDAVRGNIQTRIDKMLQLSQENQSDGLVVAKAAIDRLLDAEQLNRDGDDFSASVKTLRQALNKCQWMVLPASQNPPAAAQGALVIETASNRHDLVKILETINCKTTFDDISEERSILASHGGGCHQKIGVWVQSNLHGKTISLRGETEKGKILQSYSMESKNPLPKNIKTGQVFPPSRYSSMFKRDPIFASLEDKGKISRSNEIFLASTHIPDEYLKEINGQIVWASGVASWFAFASKSIWINGVDDNLGSFEPRRIDNLLGRAADWLALSHDQSPLQNRINTYRLLNDMDELRIDEEQYFYWRSGTAFKRALKLAPDIANGVHACGLGRTFAAIRKILGEGATIIPFVSEQDWKNQINERQKTRQEIGTSKCND